MNHAARNPRYLTLADALRSDIASGKYVFGDRLPSEPELSRSFGVSRGTVVKAVELLVSEGLAVRKQGAGTFVARTSLRREPGRLMSFTETVAAQGKTAAQRILSYEPADELQAKSLGCFEPVMRLTRLRLVDGVSTSLHVCFVPDAVLECLSNDAIEQMQRPGITNFSLYSAFEAAGIEIASATEHVTARLAFEDEAQALGLADPAAVMVVTRRSTDARGRLIEVTEAVYQSEYYTYEVNLLRGARHAIPFHISDILTDKNNT